jgi:non-ribosomal peptide synthetase component E (peptide arylation enzyme)
MDPIEKRELRRKAWTRLAAQRRRAGILRGRVVVVSLICFAILWGVVFAQMATGTDPVLSGKEKAAARTVATAKQAVETTEPRELEPRRSRDDEVGSNGEEVQIEPEAGEEPAQIEPEPLVTSQS